MLLWPILLLSKGFGKWGSTRHSKNLMWADGWRVKDITKYNRDSTDDGNHHQNNRLSFSQTMRSTYGYIINDFKWYFSFRNKAINTRLLTAFKMKKARCAVLQILCLYLIFPFLFILSLLVVWHTMQRKNIPKYIQKIYRKIYIAKVQSKRI